MIRKKGTAPFFTGSLREEVRDMLNLKKRELSPFLLAALVLFCSVAFAANDMPKPVDNKPKASPTGKSDNVLKDTVLNAAPDEIMSKTMPPEAAVSAEIGEVLEELGPDETTDEATAQTGSTQKIAGIFFDNIEVPESNYYFAKSVVAVFGNKFGKQPKTPEETEEAVWDQLILSFLAYQNNINAAQEEADLEIDKILQASKAEFDRKKDPAAYEKWVKEKTNEPVDLFENQIKHLVQIQKLKDDVMKKLDPAVTDDEALEGFMNENTSLDVELIQFDGIEDAKAFYDKVSTDARKWDKEKSGRAGDFKRPGGVTAQFLIDFWGFKSKDLLDMAGQKPGTIYKPCPIYKGWGVFKVMGSTPADKAKFDDKAKQVYVDKIKAGKKYEGFNQWLEKMRKDANIRVTGKG